MGVRTAKVIERRNRRVSKEARKVENKGVAASCTSEFAHLREQLSSEIDELVLGWLQKLDSPAKIAVPLGASGALAVIDWLRDLEDVQELPGICCGCGLDDEAATRLYDHGSELVTKLFEDRQAQKAHDLLNKNENRVLYMSQPVIACTRPDTFRSDPDGISDLRCDGLMAKAIHTRWKAQSEPCFVSVVNALPLVFENDNDLVGHQPPVSDSAWRQLEAANIMISGERLGINISSQAYEWTLKMFPVDIMYSAYVHSLNSPVIPSGYLEDLPVSFQVIKGLQYPVARGHLGPIGQMIDLGHDGSGVYNPQHQRFRDFVARYGKVSFQFRFITDDGVFAKGICRPVEWLDQDQAVVLDWIQIKGAWKQLAKERRGQNAVGTLCGYMGVMRAFNKPGKLVQCFEGLENLVVKHSSKLLIEELVAEAMTKLADAGVDGLVADVAKDNQRIQTMVMLCSILDVSPLQIPQIRQLVDLKLGKKLYKIAQGGGMSFPRYFAIIDSRLNAGEVIVSGAPYPVECAIFRFPMVLAQGLVTAQSVQPFEDQLVDGKLPPNMIYMSPHDIVTKMQGDDDGDFCGCSFDPRHVELFNMIDDQRVFHIEPLGVARTDEDGNKITSRSSQGREFILHDQQGPVGLLTHFRTVLKALKNELAAADPTKAVALSVNIQEAIDRAKRLPRWSNYLTLQEIGNWHIDEAGEYHVRAPNTDDNCLPMEIGDDLDMEAVMDFVGDIKASCGLDPKANVLGWKWPGKRIIPSKWEDTATRQMYKGRVGFTGGNLVHHSHDHALKCWDDISDIFNMDAPEVELQELIPKLMATHGITIDRNMNWLDYTRNLRTRSGLNKFGNEYGKIKGSRKDEETQGQLIQQEADNLDARLMTLDAQEIAQIWWMEMGDWRKNPDEGAVFVLGTDGKAVSNPNYGWRVISVKNSPVLQALGLLEAGACSQNTPEATRAAADYCMKSDNPLVTLQDLLITGTRHHSATGVAGWACKSCCDSVTNEVIRRIREDRHHQQNQWVLQVITQTRLARPPRVQGPADQEVPEVVEQPWD